MEELEQLFDKWNDPSLTTAQRMRNGETLSPGFALLVKKGKEMDSHVTLCLFPIRS